MNKLVSQVINSYPPAVREKVLYIRKLVYETAGENENIPEVEESLKWGEPAYKTKFGSTMRIAAKKNNNEEFGVYFQCTSRLIPVFREVFQESLRFEGNRAIIFNVNDNIPENIIKKCISTALQYHRVKNLPTLGI